MAIFSKFVEHKAQHGERWDDLAYKYYGNCFKVNEIIQANPSIAISPFLPEGKTIIIPIFDKKLSNNADLPIWKQTI